MIRFFISYISKINISEVIFTFLAILCLISILFRTRLKGKKHLTIWISASLYISLLLELTILTREPGMISYSKEDMLLTFRMMLQNSKESQMYPDIIGNIILFVPCGVFLKTLLRRSSWTILVSFFVTLAVESVQLITGRGLFEISDLIFNTIGAAIGVWIYNHIRIQCENNTVKRYKE